MSVSRLLLTPLVAMAFSAAFHAQTLSAANAPAAGAPPAVRVGGYFVETAAGRITLPLEQLTPDATTGNPSGSVTLPDGHQVFVAWREDERGDWFLTMNARPADDVRKWGFAIEAASQEYFTGLMERVVDGRQQASWAPGITEAMDLRGQKVEMLVKPTTSVYAPYFLSSRGYAVFVQGDWPGFVDFCVDDPQHVRVEWEGPSFAAKIYRATEPAELVRRHALDAGPPILPPKWMFSPWRWRNEHRHREAYYDGTPVTGPFNSEVMEDILMMRAYGIPCGVYWIDRPWGPGAWGYDDFEIDAARLPNFEANIRWLAEQNTKTVLWIGPFYQGQMATEALAKGYNLAGQVRPPNGNNFPLVDMTNPAAKRFWQEGVAKLLRMGVAGFKLDRGEENMPDDGPFHAFDGRTIRENRNGYAPMYLKATYDIAREIRGDDFVLLPRAAYTGSAAYGVFWGGDVGSTQEGLRASIIAVQRSAVMGYPNWGSDTGGYTGGNMDQEVNARWLGFSCFTPIFEVGPTRDVGYWNLPREPNYDEVLIAAWRLYARLHERLADYGYAHAQEAARTGMPIVRPLFLIEPQASEAWSNWWTYQYGADILVSPIWEKGRREQEVYFPSGSRWRDAWRPDKIYEGGTTATVPAEVHQIPIFVRVGAKVSLGDLNREWQQAQAAAARRPDLKTLDASVRQWFERRGAAPAASTR